jgi:hypothetical protein
VRLVDCSIIATAHRAGSRHGAAEWLAQRAPLTELARIASGTCRMLRPTRPVFD